jgi:hybrid cluster-associated redox disulfide protein
MHAPDDAVSPAPDIGIARLLGRHPETATVFLAHRMACVGCSLAAFETLADAAREYQLPLAVFLGELARAAADPGENR